MRHLLLDLDAPLMSFGGDMVDAYGVVRDFPAKSMVAGLLANALGWERHDAAAHAALQERLVMGSARVREGRRIQDYQTARLGAEDMGWTSWGRTDCRNKTSNSYQPDWEHQRRTGKLERVVTHIRYRDADADGRVLVALRLDAAGDTPDLDQLAAALDSPERPLFIGRKPFLPSRPFRLGFVEADTIREALAAALALLPETPEDDSQVCAQWPAAEGLIDGAQEEELTDERHWPAGVHAGLRRVAEGHVTRAEASA